MTRSQRGDRAFERRCRFLARRKRRSGSRDIGFRRRLGSDRFEARLRRNEPGLLHLDGRRHLFEHDLFEKNLLDDLSSAELGRQVENILLVLDFRRALAQDARDVIDDRVVGLDFHGLGRLVFLLLG